VSLIHYIRPRTKQRILAGQVPNWISRDRRAQRILRVCLSTPLWLRPAELRGLQELAIWQTEMTGVQHVLDHIIPVNHPRVSGLTVPWNLQVVPWRVNAAKGNTWDPDQLELEFQ